ncbi:MAG: UPF0182 family protein [Pyrinomonadaceae bacterium]
MDKLEYSDLNDDIIDITPQTKRRGGRIKWFAIPVVLLLIALFSSIGIYTDSLWFGSLGFSSRFWYVFALGWILFAVFAILTVAILRGGFYILERLFGPEILKPRKIVVNKQAIDLSFARFLRPLSWLVALVFGIGFGLSLSSDWNTWALYLHQPSTATTDPIFGKSIGFYLFTLPIYNQLAAWLTTLSLVLLAGAVLYALLSTVPERSIIDDKDTKFSGFGTRAYAAVSAALGSLLIIAAWRTMLSRYAYLWTDHSSFSGVTYTEDNYLLPGLAAVAIALVIAAIVLFVNAFTNKGGRLFLVALGLCLVVYVVAAMIVPAYVQSFIVKPNELGRETPYIEHNIAGTRTGFNIENVTSRDYAADITPDSLNLAANRSTLSNIRLWDWQALQDTLRQIQEIRTYYDFPDVDVDRYRIGGEMRQVMIATRELDVNKLPEQSRNWINERLVYTHGYGVTMNPVNEFTDEGKPRFLISNMPLTATPDVQVTRPEIYFGERTETNVYVRTKQPEFDYPQGENNNYTNYEGDGGFAVGSGLRRFCVAWAMGDLSKLPFSDDVTSESRVLMHRNITDRIRRIAPFLTYDDDPYMVINADGRLVWMVDAYTSANRFPYSRHFNVSGRSVNYIRNSVKVTIDAYTGAVNYYVFDEADPVVAAYRAAFPELFKPAAEMPDGLRVHIRYPETLIKAQADVFGLYHTTNAKMFFGREDVWSIAREAQPAADDAAKPGAQQQPAPLEPYQVLMPLPGERAEPEFAKVLPFTPGNRNNMIAWMAGRSDGEAYGQLLVYVFPPSRVIDGPLQIEARIDQDAQLSGQITLWNQQGSKVKRGNLIIMPIGTGLLFVEPIYLQAVRSPMPELRIVVLATQERLVYGENFEAALTQLLGQPQKTAAKQTDDKKPGETPAAAPSADELIKRAGQTFADYQRLTATGKLAEAGQKLDDLKRILDQLQGQQK